MFIINIKNSFESKLMIYVAPLLIQFSHTFLDPVHFKVVIKIWNNLEVQWWDYMH